ncbi:hypothetical protein V2J09_004244 [Rumex salicifolius]
MYGEDILIANHIPNKFFHNKLDKTPYELWKGHPPNLNFFKKPRRSKREKKATSFGPEFMTVLLNELDDYDELNETFISLYMLKGDSKISYAIVSSLDASF